MGLFLVFFGIVVGVIVFYDYVKDVLKLIDFKLWDLFLFKLFDKDGKVFVEVGIEWWEYIEYKDIFEILKNVILIMEDVCFYEYDGIDLIWFGGVVIVNLIDGFGVEGVSIFL